jgi:pyruvate dehydrogenase E2 component (dihydrolipoamide acetyltransferase)
LIHTREKSSSHHAVQKEVQATDVASASTVEKVPASATIKSFEQIRISPRARKAAREAGLDLGQVSGSGIRGMIVTADLPTKATEGLPVIKATPVARKMAAETGVDLAGVTGTGPRGMVRKEDVEKCRQSLPAPVEPAAPEPLSGLRKVIAERLGKSWNERPQANLTTEVDASLFVKARVQINQELSKKDIKISYNTLLIKLVAQAIHEFPYMNVSLLPEGLQHHNQVNVGLAVDTPRGLMVPVVRDADRKNFECIQQDLDAVIQRTLAGTATWDDVTGGTFTITNLGAFDIDAFTPLINPPESAILGIGRIH